MIKFFRRIRMDLLEQNKTLKYFKYAIGEIVLVVIGILIAIQINNWNEGVQNRKLETSYLNRILKDLDSDLLQFEDAIDLAEQRNERVLFLQKAAEEDLTWVQKSSDYFVKSIVFAGYTYRPSISNHSFEELKSTGRLALIGNEQLRVSLAKYYDYLSNYRQWNFINEDVQTKYNNLSSGILKQEQFDPVISKSENLNLSDEEIEEIFQRFASKKEFHDLLTRVFQVKYEIIESIGVSREMAKDLKEEIQAELQDS